MNSSSIQPRVIGRGRGRPAQALYMPPAQRNRQHSDNSDKMKSDIRQVQEHHKEKEKSRHLHEEKISQINESLTSELQDFHVDHKTNIDKITIESPPIIVEPPAVISTPEEPSPQIREPGLEPEPETEQEPERHLENIIINTHPAEILTQVGNKSVQFTIKDKSETRSTNEADKENKKSKPINMKTRDVVKCDVLPISVAKNVKKSPIKLVQVDEWEDLFNDDDDDAVENAQNDASQLIVVGNDSDTDDESWVLTDEQLEHIVEIYDFPATFRTADIMQIYNQLDQNTLYIKWLGDTRALLVLGSAIQAKRALNIENPFIKSRPVALGSAMALEAVRTGNLRPAMKRPQTSMHAARRMITTALGAKNHVSREVQQKEREALRKAKEERRTQRQNERDAWEGNPRPTTA